MRAVGAAVETVPAVSATPEEATPVDAAAVEIPEELAPEAPKKGRRR